MAHDREHITTRHIEEGASLPGAPCLDVARLSCRRCNGPVDLIAPDDGQGASAIVCQNGDCGHEQVIPRRLPGTRTDPRGFEAVMRRRAPRHRGGFGR